MSHICYPLQATQATGNNLRRYHLSHHNFHKEYLQHHCKIHYIRNQMPQIKHSCFLCKPCRTRYSQLHHQLYRINTPKHRIKRFHRPLFSNASGNHILSSFYKIICMNNFILPLTLS